MAAPLKEQRETIHERPWAGHGPLAVHRRLDGRRVIWYAADDTGILALGESAEDLDRVLRHSGCRRDSLALGDVHHSPPALRLSRPRP